MVVLGLATALPVAAAARYPVTRMRKTLGHPSSQRLSLSLVRFALGARSWPNRLAGGHRGPTLAGAPARSQGGIFAAALVGVAIYGSVQSLWGTPEASWLAGGLRHMRTTASRTAAGTITASGPLRSPAAGPAGTGSAPARRPGSFRWPPGRWLIWPTLAGAVSLGG